MLIVHKKELKRGNKIEIKMIVSKFLGKFTSLKSLKSHKKVVESHGISKAQNMNSVNYFGGQLTTF